MSRSLMLINVLAIMLTLPSTIQGELGPSEENKLSLPTNTPTWNSVFKLLQSNPSHAICVLMRYPASECERVWNKKRADAVDVVVEDDLSEETGCQGRHCGRSRTADRDEPYTGPKRFYNNW